MAVPKNYKKLFDTRTKRITKIALTISPKYVSLSSGALEEMGHKTFVTFATDEKKPKIIFVFPSEEQEDGSFRIYNADKKRSVKIVRPAIAKQLAETLGLDNSNQTWRISGTFDEKDGCLVFDGKNAEKR